MEHHLLRHIQNRIKEAKEKIRNLQRTVQNLESRTTALPTLLIEQFRRVRVDDILPLFHEFEKLVSDESLSPLRSNFYSIHFYLNKIEDSLRFIASRNVQNHQVNSLVKNLLDSSSNIISEIEKLHTFIDFYIEENTIKLINDWIGRIKLFVLTIRQHAQLLSGIREINQNNYENVEPWVIKLERFRLENIEPLRDKFNLLLSRRLSGELGEYVATINAQVKAIEEIYKLSPMNTEGLEEKYHKVNDHLDVIDDAVNKMERFVLTIIK